MVLINTLKIDELANTITVDVNTTVGNLFTSLYVWTASTYKVDASKIDLTADLAGTSETETLTITAADLGVTSIKGLYFFEFTTDEIVSDDSNVGLGIVANFIDYHTCVLDKLLSITSVSCDGASYSGCSDCNEKVFYINTVLETVYSSIQFGFYEEAIKMLSTLDTMCGVCADCPSYETPLLINGLGFSTSDNNIILS